MPAADAPKRGDAKRRPAKQHKKPVGVLAPGAKFDAKTGKATPPKNPVFQRNLPDPGPKRPKPKAPERQGYGRETHKGTSINDVMRTIGRGRRAADKVLSGDAAGPLLEKAHKFFEDNSEGIGKAIVGVAQGPTRVGVKEKKDGKTKRLAAAQVVRADGDTVKRAGRLGAGFANDAIDLPANAIPSLYLPARELHKGNVKGAAKMVADPFIAAAKDPGGEFEKHPLNTILMGLGAKAVVGRGAGKALRTVPSEKARKVGSLKRPAADEVVPDTGIRKEGRYSKDVIDKAFQVAADKALKRDPAKPRTMPSSGIKRRANEAEGASEDIRRIRRAERGSRTREAIGKKPTAAVNLVAQGIVKPNRDSLLAYRKQLEGEAGKLEGVRLRANEQLRRQIDDAVDKGNFEEVTRAAREYTTQNRALQRRLVKTGLVDPKAAETARLTPYAVQHMGARFEKDGDGLVTDSGPLPNRDIRKHMRDNGVDATAFITQAPYQRGARNFFVPTSKAPSSPSKKRTGQATREGTFDAHPDILIEQAQRTEGLVTAAERFSARLKEFAVRDDDGKGEARRFDNYDKAREAAANLSHEKGVRYVPVRANPFAGARAQLDELVRSVDADAPSSVRSVIHAAFDEAVEGRRGGDGPYMLIPEDAARTWRDHSGASSSPLGKAGNLYGSLFRRNVLAFSPKWLTGNIVEGITRTVVGHTSWRSAQTGQRVVRELEKIDPKAAEELRVRAIGGGHYSLVDRNNVHVTAESWAGSRFAPIAEAIGKLDRTPGPKQFLQLYHAWTDFVFHSVNGKLEHNFQQAMLGKALRDHPLMSQHTRKLSEKAIKEAAEGLRNTNTQVELGRQVDRMYGRYGKFSPTLRKSIASYTPFIAWSLNAVTFLFDVLPRDHPVLTGLIASANVASEEWRKERGLVMHFVDRPENGAPDWMQGSIPGNEGDRLRVSRYTPFGLFAAQGGALGNLQGLVLPQFNGVLQNVEGKDWSGASLAKRGEQPSLGHNAAAAGVSFIENTIPLFSWIKAGTGAQLPNQKPDRQQAPTALERLRQFGDPGKFTTDHREKGEPSGFSTGSAYGDGAFSDKSAFSR